MRATRLVVGLVMAVWIFCAAPAHASPFTFQTIPTGGAISGALGSTIGWGYSLTNTSLTDWLVLTAVSASGFQHATPNASIFDFPILAPFATLSVPYIVGTSGLFEITWDLTAPVGFVNSGIFTVSAEWWSGDPFAGGQFLGSATDQFASYSATATPVATVPELSSLMFVVAAALTACLRRLTTLRGLSLTVLVLGLPAQALVAQQVDPRAQVDSASPCCAAVNFQTFDPQDVAIQLVSVKRTGTNDITVTWQILNRSKTAQQFDKMNGVAAYQLVWDAEVVDFASRTRFKVASDSKTRTPFAAKHEPPRASQGVALQAGRTLTTWAKFLVPAGVTKVTVSLPGAAKPWENVPITQ